MIEEHKLPSWLSKELDSFGISPYSGGITYNDVYNKPIVKRDFKGRYFKDGEEIPF